MRTALRDGWGGGGGHSAWHTFGRPPLEPQRASAARQEGANPRRARASLSRRHAGNFASESSCSGVCLVVVLLEQFLFLLLLLFGTAVVGSVASVDFAQRPQTSITESIESLINHWDDDSPKEENAETRHNITVRQQSKRGCGYGEGCQIIMAAQ